MTAKKSKRKDNTAFVSYLRIGRLVHAYIIAGMLNANNQIDTHLNQAIEKMINKLDKELNYHHNALSLRVARQELLSSNVANADTPNFKAKDIDFASVLNERLSSTPSLKKVNMNTTSAMHINSAASGVFGDNILYRVPLQPSADGNTVDMDMERTRFADNAIKYDASITFINNEFRNLTSAMLER